MSAGDGPDVGISVAAGVSVVASDSGIDGGSSIVIDWCWKRFGGLSVCSGNGSSPLPPSGLGKSLSRLSMFEVNSCGFVEAGGNGAICFMLLTIGGCD